MRRLSIGTPTRRAAASLVALIMLLVFLLGLTLQKLEKEKLARQKFQTELMSSQNSIVDKLVEIFTPIIKEQVAAVANGNPPGNKLSELISRLEGIDSKLIEEAVKRAQQNAGVAPTGTTSATRPTPTTTTARESTTTSTTSTTTTTIKPLPTTTTSSSTTTTTRPCALDLPGVLKLCLH